MDLLAAEVISREHIEYAVVRFLEGFQDMAIDIPLAGVYLGSVLAAAWSRDRSALPPMAFLLACGAAPLPDGEEYDEFDVKNRMR